MAAKSSPIQLVVFDKASHTFKVTEEGASYLSSLDRPLAVIGVVGRQKTGKTFFADRVILDHKPAVTSTGVSHTIQTGTRGICVFPEEISADNDPEKHIIVLDSQGMGSPENDQNFDSRIFSICVLMSSLVIYNSIGAIDEGALESIELVGHLAKEIKLEDAKGKVCTSLFPSFFWLLRDFSLRLEDPQGKKINAQEYLESCLETTKGLSEANEKRNKTRRVIKYLFEQRDCGTLVRPALTEFEVQRLDKLKSSELRPEFVDQCKKLRTKLLKSVDTKIVAKTAATGPILLEYLKQVLEAMNCSRTLVLPSLQTSVVGSFNELLLANFKANVESVQTEDEWLVVWKKSIGEDDDREKLRKELELVSAQEFQRRKTLEMRKRKEENGHDLMSLNREQIEKTANESNIEHQIYDRGTFGEIGENMFIKTKNHKSMIVGEEKQATHGRSDSNPRAANFGNHQWISGPPSQIAGSLRGSVALDGEPVFWKGGDEGDRPYLVMESTVEKEKIKIELDLLKKRLEEKNKEQETQRRSLEKAEDTIKLLNSRILELEIEKSRSQVIGEEASKESERLLAKNNELKKRLESLKEQIDKDKEDRETTIPLSEHYTKLDETKTSLHFKLIDTEKNLVLKEHEIAYLKKEAENLKLTVDELRSDKKQLYDDLFKLRAKFENESTSKVKDDDSFRKTIERNVWLESKFKELQEMNEDLKTKNQKLEEEKKKLLLLIEENKKNSEQMVNSYQQQLLMNTKAQDSQSANWSSMNQKHSAALDELRSLKSMLDKAMSISCSTCRANVPVGNFPSHICQIPVQNYSLLDSSILTLHKQPQTSTRKTGLQVEILEVMVKENRENRRLYVEYKMKAKRGKKEWEVIRKYKEFCEFWTEIQKKFSVENFSPMVKDLFKLSRGPEGLPSSSMADRHKTLQEFLSEVSQSPMIAASEIVKTFLAEKSEERDQPSFEEADETITEKTGTSFMLRDLDTPKVAGSPIDRKRSIPSGMKESKSQAAVGLTKNKNSPAKIEVKGIQGISSSSRRVNLAKYLPKK